MGCGVGVEFFDFGDVICFGVVEFE